MGKNIDNNTTTTQPTHFLRGVELIKQAMKDTGFCSENWAYPTIHSYGFAQDRYYAEVWLNGMDWNSVYWLIEASGFCNPEIYPMLYFEDNYQREKYNDCDFRDLCNAIMHYRREIVWIKSENPKGYYADIVWPFIRRIEPEERLETYPNMVKYRILHASQSNVEFYMNENLIPEQEPVSNRIENGNAVILSEYPLEVAEKQKQKQKLGLGSRLQTEDVQNATNATA